MIGVPTPLPSKSSACLEDEHKALGMEYVDFRDVRRILLIAIEPVSFDEHLW